MPMRKRITLLTIVIFAALSVGLVYGASSSSTGVPVLVNYFSNANTSGFPDGTVQLTNPGETGGTICADIYVFYPDEEMAECCGCTLTPNDLRTLSVNTNLTSNPLTGTVPTSGVIYIVSGAGPTCAPNKLSLVPPTINAWGTHILAPSTGGFAITETDFQSQSLSGAEVTALDIGCQSIVNEGSGHGVCSCGSGS
jgi:hypothetical protein